MQSPRLTSSLSSELCMVLPRRALETGNSILYIHYQPFCMVIFLNSYVVAEEAYVEVDGRREDQGCFYSISEASG